MTPTWKVKALKMGELTVDKSTLTYLKNFGQSEVIPIWATAVYGGGLNILVDTGIHDSQWVRNNYGPCNQTDDEQIVDALKVGLGWTPDEIDIVINTHLHWDHCGNNRLFKKARFVIQKQEWSAAHNPIQTQSNFYLPELFDSIEYFDWIFVYDEYEVAPGVKVFLTPGHSEGHQSVLVKTEEGKLCISGDVSALLENIRDNIPAGILTSLGETYTSMERIRGIAQRILPGHEPSIREYQESGFPTI